MSRLLFSCLALAACLSAADDPVFRSEVAMSRVDARVVDRDGRPVTGLLARDFVLRLDGKDVPVRNFANENTPIDILLLLDVSGSMEPHVQRIASAAQQALNVLADRDRVAIMVFDTRARVRLPFRSSHGEITSELNRLLRSERFNGGTRITSALLEAARYTEREARPDARRAIVILTDDQTQDDADEGRVEDALRRAGAVLSFLQAPYEEPQFMGRRGGRRSRGTWGSGGGWPGGGGGWPGSGGPIGFPGGGPGGGGPGGIDRSHSAGTETIAHDSGGDTMPVRDAAALEDTLSRLRQRYALYFYLPEGAQSHGRVEVSLSEAASLRYHDAEIQSRRVFISGGSESADQTVVTKVQPPPETPTRSGESNAASVPARRGRAVNEDSGTKVNTVGESSDSQNTPGATQSTTTTTTPASTSPSTTSTAPAPQKGGWPRANPNN